MAFNDKRIYHKGVIMNDTFTYVSQQYSQHTCLKLVQWIKNHCDPETESGILTTNTKKLQVVMVSTNLEDVSAFANYLRTITLV
jgi:hypothetical protein